MKTAEELQFEARKRAERGDFVFVIYPSQIARFTDAQIPFIVAGHLPSGK